MSFKLKNVNLIRGGDYIVSNLNLEIFPGQCIWLKGLNGSGKTTFLEFLGGFYPLSKGFLINPSNYLFFFLPVSIFLDSKITVYEYIDFWSSCLKKKDKKLFLKFFDLQPFISNSIESLSWGTKRRVVLSILPIISSKVWLLDEPFVGLDFHNKNKLILLLKWHLKKGGIVFFSHHEKILLNIDRVINFPFSGKFVFAK